MRSAPASALLVRGSRMKPFAASLDTARPEERWLEAEGFARSKGGGRWAQDLAAPRVVQTGIVNLEAARRFVAAEVPAGVYLGNSVNYWVPRTRPDLDAAAARAYLLGLLNSAPLEWRFRLTSSNHNINLYEVRGLPLPRLLGRFPAAHRAPFLEDCRRLFLAGDTSPLSAVRRITSRWGSPSRDDVAVAWLIGGVSRLREAEPAPRRQAWLEHALDHLVNWHLGLDEPDLDRMLRDIPARRWEK
jgi:hypothetical protein